MSGFRLSVTGFRVLHECAKQAVTFFFLLFSSIGGELLGNYRAAKFASVTQPQRDLLESGSIAFAAVRH